MQDREKMQEKKMKTMEHWHGTAMKGMNGPQINKQCRLNIHTQSAQSMCWSSKTTKMHQKCHHRSRNCACVCLASEWIYICEHMLVTSSNSSDNNNNISIYYRMHIIFVSIVYNYIRYIYTHMYIYGHVPLGSVPFNAGRRYPTSFNDMYSKTTHARACGVRTIERAIVFIFRWLNYKNT